MSRTSSTSELTKFLEENVEQIEAIRKEVEEIQLGFQNEYVNWITKHDTELIRLTDLVISRQVEIGPELEALIQKQLIDEEKTIIERQRSLRDEIIPKLQAEMDAVLVDAQAKTAELSQLNPKLNSQEENLKSSLAENRSKLDKLNTQMSQLSRGLGGILHFKQLGELDRQRYRLIGRMQELEKSLGDVRKEWVELHKLSLSEQSDLQANYQRLLTDMASRQAELNYLEAAANRAKLALERAVRSILDNLKEPVNCPATDLQAEILQMVEYNHQTDDYHAGLAEVGGLIGMLGSVQEGIHRFSESLKSLHDQEAMHSQYLPALKIVLPDDALQFSQLWPGLRKQVADEKYLSAHPLDFIQRVQPVLDSSLSVQRLSAVFDGLGQALQAATASWGK